MSVEAVPLKYYPVNVTCPKCKQDIKTKTDGKVSKSGWIMGLALCFCGLFPCALIPCCFMQITTHRCPKCKVKIGKYQS